MTTALEKLRAAQHEADEKKNSAAGNSAAYFKFYNAKVGQTSTVRFLPDGDDNSSFFWAERRKASIKFAGQVGGEYPTDDEVTVSYLCPTTFRVKNPILERTKKWWKTDKEEMARMYYFKKSHILQGLVVATPIEETRVPENPIRLFELNPSIFEIIFDAVMKDEEREHIPTDYENGSDFRIVKTQKGQYANYGTSSFSARVRPLNEVERAALSFGGGLFNLKEQVGTPLSSDAIAMLLPMFEDSLAGKPFDYASYGSEFKSWAPRNGAGAGAKTAGAGAGEEDSEQRGEVRDAKSIMAEVRGGKAAA